MTVRTSRFLILALVREGICKDGPDVKGVTTTPITSQPFVTNGANRRGSVIAQTANEVAPPLTCATSLSTCRFLGCFDPTTQKCCEDGPIFCLITETCVVAQLSDGSMKPGCCPSGTAPCGGTCIDVSQYKCCVLRGEKSPSGLCPLGTDCCGDGCCAHGEVCVGSFDGMRCWPQVESIEQHHRIEAFGNTTLVLVTTASSTGTASASVSDKKSRACGRLILPKLLLALILLVPVVTANVNLTPVFSNMQALPVVACTQPVQRPRLVTKRWSCHTPKLACGLKGCHDPATSICCTGIKTTPESPE